MTIPNVALKGNQKLILAIAIILLTPSASFFLGMLADRTSGQGGPAAGGSAGQGIGSNGLSIGSAPLKNGLPAAVLAADETASDTPIAAGGEVVASKNGKSYYLPWCTGVSRIGEANKVWFASAQEAEAKGLTPAKGCPGL